MTAPNPTDRTRLIQWADPAPAAQVAQTMSGLDYLQAIVTGQLPPPPIANLLNMQLVEVSQGRAVFTVQPSEYHYNPIGAVHGGLAATLCDSAMACAIHSTLSPGKAYTTVELHVNYIRPIIVQTSLLRCIGQIIHVGRRIATAEARLLDNDDKLYAHATTTCIIL